MEYQPKGGMCAGCVNKDWDCSYLKFEDMKPYKVDESLTIVICTYYKKEKVLDL